MSSLFGLSQSNQLVHVSEVERGLACQCRCVVCEEPLIARQGQVRGHHFAHASDRAPCDSSHESLLHRYAKQLVADAGGLVVPMTAAVAQYFASADSTSATILMTARRIEEEVCIGEIRPDLLLCTSDGTQVAVEIAYSSFCDLLKISAFEQIQLPVLEVDLSRFTPDNFDPAAVKEAVIGSALAKTWLWPTSAPAAEADSPAPPDAPTPTAQKTYLPEELLDFSGRWVSIKQFPSGDIAVKVVSYDPDLVSLVRSVARAHGGRFNAQYKTWNVPRWAAGLVRQRLRRHATSLQLGMNSRQQFD
jgi:competence protein CoiA